MIYNLMKLSELKSYLQECEYPVFQLPSWEIVPAHYHITEIGTSTKKFVDCGGTLRTEKHTTLQLRYSNDTDHRLTSTKLLNIIDFYMQKVSDSDHMLHIEHQWPTIQIYWLQYINNTFVLTPTYTDCLAKDACGIPSTSDTDNKNSCCGGWCC